MKAEYFKRSRQEIVQLFTEALKARCGGDSETYRIRVSSTPGGTEAIITDITARVTTDSSKSICLNTHELRCMDEDSFKEITDSMADLLYLDCTGYYDRDRSKDT